MAGYKEIFEYDLMAKIRSDHKKATATQKLIDHVRNVHALVAEGKAERTEIARAAAAVVTYCGFNFGLMVPYVFPKYPRTDPLSLIERPFMFVMTSLAANNVLTLRAGRQVGKCADEDTEVTTESHGNLTMGQLFEMGTVSS